MKLPKPALKSESSLEQVLQTRRSVREYGDDALKLKEISQLLWAAQGVTHSAGYRTAPSAGALYPLEIYLAAGNVDGLTKGVYHYRPHDHSLKQIAEKDLRHALAGAALDQPSVGDAPVVLAIAAVYERTMSKYGKRGIRYVHMEVGHAAQNVLLQAQAIGLATVVVGAFEDSAVSDVLRLPAEVEPLMLIPVGRM
jgi:SagB-type dehydrogenase family enzyme